MTLDPLDQPPAGTTPHLGEVVGPVDTEAIWARCVGVAGVLICSIALLVPILGDAGPGLSLLVTAAAAFALLRRHVPAVAYGALHLSGLGVGLLTLWLS